MCLYIGQFCGLFHVASVTRNNTSMDCVGWLIIDCRILFYEKFQVNVRMILFLLFSEVGVIFIIRGVIYCYRTCEALLFGNHFRSPIVFSAFKCFSVG